MANSDLNWALIHILTKRKLKHELYKREMWTRRQAYELFVIAAEDSALEFATLKGEKENESKRG